MMAWQVLAKAGAALLTDRETRKRAGQALALVLSPLVLLVAFLCCLASGTAQHNAAAADLCFLGGPLPEDLDFLQRYFENKEKKRRDTPKEEPV